MSHVDVTVDEATINAIRQRMLETGDWERIQKLLRAHLEESGWVDDLKDLAEEKARAQDVPNLESLVKQISESAAGEFIPFSSPLSVFFLFYITIAPSILDSGFIRPFSCIID
ncbi:protein SUS1 [Cryptococcus neoformans AD2-60a]|nr:protein SUS1 [Cryptococcus neoformans var. grubii AD2-60a]OXG33583.1 protein SUS1 [Cryptococcus neoformans var. grubii Bt15]OXG42735.1 protein SUS1 [Cryptococcus neoformans var. grubii Bt120]